MAYPNLPIAFLDQASNNTRTPSPSSAARGGQSEEKSSRIRILPPIASSEREQAAPTHRPSGRSAISQRLHAQLPHVVRVNLQCLPRRDVEALLLHEVVPDVRLARGSEDRPEVSPSPGPVRLPEAER